MNELQDKVVWITGASSGIGEQLAVLAADSGAKIVLSSRNVESLKLLKSSLKSSEKHLVLPLDLEKSVEFPDLVGNIIEKYRRVDVLINNGGISQRLNAIDTSLEMDRRIMEVNYFGNIALTKALLPQFRKQGSGHLVIISSIAGKFGFFLRSAYSASKHALHGFYESLMLEEEKNGLKVTMVCPGKIKTNISLNALSADGIPHGKMGSKEETSMTANECARQILKAVVAGKKEVLIGNKEIKAVWLKRFFPRLFWKVIRKQSAT